MKYYYLVRWGAGKAKLRGHTIRRTPSEVSYELVLLDEEDVLWYRFSGDILKEKQAFAQHVDIGAEEARRILARIEEAKTLEVEPGHVLNPTKDTRVFLRLKEKGPASVLEDTPFIKRYRVGRKTVVLEPRPGLEGQFRASVGTRPGAPRLNFRYEPDGPDTYTLYDIPVACAGVWNGVHITDKMLEDMVHAFQLTKHKVYVPLKLDHHGIQESEEVHEFGPALGWLVDLKKKGSMLVGTFAKVPRAVLRLILNGQYTGISPEITKNFAGHPYVLTAVALLGAAMPAMTSLPRLLSLYHQAIRGGEVLRPRIEKGKLLGGETMAEVTQNQEVEAPAPLSKELVRLLFQRAARPEDLEELVRILVDKGYPRTLALEMLEFMPDPSKEKVEMIPEYTRDLWTARLDVLEDRAYMPEKAEKVIQELEEFLELHGDELEDEEKARVQRILDIAKEHKGITELEEALEAEKYPKYPTAPGKTPTEAERYPQTAPNVTIEMQKNEEEMRALKEELKRRAERERDLVVQTFASRGYNETQLKLLSRILTLTDPVLSPQADPQEIKTLVFQLLETLEQRTETFSVKTEPEAQSEGLDYVEELFRHSRQGRLRR